MHEFAIIQEVVRNIRNFWAEHNILPAGRAQAYFGAGQFLELIRSQANVIAALTGLDASRLEIHEELRSRPEMSLPLVAGPIEVYLPLEGMVDLDKEHKRLEKELSEAESHVARLEKLLAGDFANKAPAPVVAKEREKLSAYKETAEKLKSQLKR
jgi:valyl-tRNA synthetase